MALGSDEKEIGGFVRLISTGALVVTTNTTGARWQNGFLVDPDGRLVVASA